MSIVDNIMKIFKSDDEKVEKTLSYRSTQDTSYYAVKGKNVLMLGYEEPEEMESKTHDMDGRYALVISRGYDNSELEMLDEGVTTGEAQAQALDLIENNKNNITRVAVAFGIPKSFAGRGVFKTVATYAYMGKGDSDEQDFREITINYFQASPEDAPRMEKAQGGQGSSETQSILFPTAKYTAEQAKTWLKSHGKSSGKVDTTENFHRFRQFDPSQCASTPKTITLGKGIKAIICVRKTTKGSTGPEAGTGSGEERKTEGNFSHEVDVKMSDFSKGLVYGIVYSPNTEDTHGDWTTADEIERAAHNFLPAAKSDWTNTNHGDDTLPDVDVVESYIAPCDFKIGKEAVTKGSWVIVSRVNNSELRQSIQKGEITGYSLEGTARKT